MSKAVTFLKEAKGELGKVVWPDRKVTTASTIVVLVVSITVGLYLGVIDVALTKVFEVIYG